MITKTTRVEQSNGSATQPAQTTQTANGKQGCDGNEDVSKDKSNINGYSFHGSYVTPLVQFDQRKRGNNQPIDPTTLPGAHPNGSAGAYQALQGDDNQTQ